MNRGRREVDVLYVSPSSAMSLSKSILDILPNEMLFYALSITLEGLKPEVGSQTVDCDVLAPFKTSFPSRDWVAFAKDVCRLRMVCRFFNTEIDRIRTGFVVTYTYFDVRERRWTIPSESFEKRRISESVADLYLSVGSTAEWDVEGLCEIFGACTSLRAFAVVADVCREEDKVVLRRAIKRALDANRSTLERVMWHLPGVHVLDIIQNDGGYLRALSLRTSDRLQDWTIGASATAWTRLRTLMVRAMEAVMTVAVLQCRRDSFHCLENFGVIAKGSVPGIRDALSKCVDTVTTVIAVYPTDMVGNSVPAMAHLRELSLHIETARSNLQSAQPSLEIVRVYGITWWMEKEVVDVYQRMSSMADVMWKLRLVVGRLCEDDFAPRLRRLEVFGFPSSVDMMLLTRADRFIWNSYAEKLKERGVMLTNTTLKLDI